MADQGFHGVPGGGDAGGVVVGAVGVLGDGPVHEVEVQVGGVEVGQGFAESGLDEMGGVGGVPELGGEPVGGAGESGVGEGVADGGFVAVGGGAVEVAISSCEGVVDGGRNIFSGRLPEPEAHGRDIG